jgi:hypothetical protein
MLLVYTGIIRPVSINGQTSKLKVSQNREGIPPGHPKEVDPQPKQWMSLSTPFNQQQELLYIEIMIDQKYTLCTAANSNFNVTINLLVILSMNHREYRRPNDLELFVKDMTVHCSTSNFVNAR